MENRAKTIEKGRKLMKKSVYLGYIYLQMQECSIL